MGCRTLLAVFICAAAVPSGACAEFLARMNRRQEAVPPAPLPAPRWVSEVRILSVEVAPQRPDGQPWDVDVDEGTPFESAICGLLGAAAGVASAETGPLAPAIGTGARQVCRGVLGAREGGAATPGAPDLLVELRIGDRVVRTPVANDQFIGHFEFPFILDAADSSQGPIRVLIADADRAGPETIVSTTIGLEELAVGQTATITKEPGLREMLILTRRIDRQALHQDATLNVRADQPAVETSLAVVAGQTVTLFVEGRACTRRFLASDECVGPEGSGNAGLRSYNIPGAGDRNHLALLGLIGQSEFTIGRHTTFVSETTGNLVLVVNDRDRSNNYDGFRVRVVID